MGCLTVTQHTLTLTLTLQLRAAFEQFKPSAAVQILQRLADQKELEVKELCRVYYVDLVQSVDELRRLGSAALQLKADTLAENDRLQSCSQPLLSTYHDLNRVYEVRPLRGTWARGVPREG